MESFLPSEIARLVLGYLEDQKCEDAYNTFLKTSIHLEECLKMKEDGRKFRTQVLGLSLLDILYEYSAIYSLVQERLKKVDPEAVDRLKHSGTLLDKITFLLNSTSSGQTMLFSISLPPGNSPQTSTVAHAHVRKRLRTCSTNENKRKDNLKKNYRNLHDGDNNDLSVLENSNINRNIEATNLSSLPGNLNQNILNATNQENEIIKTPKRKLQAINKRQSRANSVVPDEVDENFDITALTKALLDNHELHEKIAENINKVICTPENNATSSVSVVGQDMCSALNPTLSETATSIPNSNNNFTMELDNVIKKIVHDTESDPIFENFLHEVVGPPTQEETSDDYDDRGISNTSTPCKSIPETVKKQNTRNRNRYTKLKRVNSSENIISDLNAANKIDDQIAVAIESIISINVPENEMIPISTTTITTTTTTTTTIAAITETMKHIETAPINSCGITATATDNSLPITVGSVNQNLTIDTSSVPAATIANLDQNILINNQNNKNVLMLGQQPIQQSSTFVITDSFPSIYQQPTIMPDNRIIFLSNKPSTLGSQYLTMQPTYQLSQPTTTVLTDNDILTMPTVFISDDPKTSSGYIISQPAYPAQPKTTRRTGINKPKARITPRELIQKKNDNDSTITQETETIKYTISIQAEPKQSTDPIEDPAPSTSGTAERSVPMISLSPAKKDVTPEKTKTTSSSKVRLSLSSPRSNKSHIRALDFSTPQKVNQAARKANTSPKSARAIKVAAADKITKSTKTTTKKLRSTLFVSPVKSTKRQLPIATKSPKVKLRGDWNEDLIVFNKKSSPRARRSVAANGAADKSLESSEDNNNTSGERGRTPTAKKFASWDQDLRSLIEPMPSTSEVKKKTPSKKRSKNAQRKEKKQNINITVEKEKQEEEQQKEVLSIETELAKMEGSTIEVMQKKNEEVEEEEEEDDDDEEEKEEETQIEKESNTKVKRKRLNSKTRNAAAGQKEENQCTLESEKGEDDDQQAKVIPVETLRNMTPRIRKKCNTNNSTKKTPTNPDDNSKQKPIENETNKHTNEMKEMTILSPSKMNRNANKRTLVEQLPKEVPPPPAPLLVPPNIITPNPLKATCSNNEISAKRNLIPVLETPMKDESILLPIMPRLFTPFNLDSPLTRILGEKMDTGDLAPFLSPSFPMTPSFPITPNIQSGDTQSSYASRPTDYSTSSSYYQPSDSEQNQKLEQVLIDEAMKIETSDLKSKHIKTSTPCKTMILPESHSNNIIGGVTAKVRLSNESLLLDHSNVLDSTSQTSSDSSSSTSSSSCSSSDDSKGTIVKDDDDDDDDETNVTVIHKRQQRQTTLHKDVPVKCKKQHSTTTSIKNHTNEKPNNKKTRGRPKKSNPQKNGNTESSTTVIKRAPGRPRKETLIVDKNEEVTAPEKHRDIKSNVTGSHVLLLKELEEKRKRIVTGLKVAKPTGRPKKNAILTTSKDNVRVTRAKGKVSSKTESHEKQKPPSVINKKVPVKIAEPPFIPRKSNTPRKSSIEVVAAKLLLKEKDKNECTEQNQQPSSSSPMYSVGSPNVSIPTVYQEDGLISYTPDEEIPRLHISSDEEDHHLNHSSLAKQNQIDDSDLLVKELKERGIYLIPNKDIEKKTEKNSIVTTRQHLEPITQLPLKGENFNEKTKVTKKTTVDETSNKSDKIEIMSDIHLDKSKVIDVSKIELSQGIITDVIGRNTSKNNETPEENCATNNVIIEPTLDISESSEYDFHVKVINENSPEFIKITYNEKNKTSKQLSDYNLTVLEKNISAKIYIEELDSWEDKSFTVTPYIDIYTVSPKRKSKMILTNKPVEKVSKTTEKTKKIPKTTDLNNKTNLKPLEILYNEYIDESSTDTIITIKEQESKTNIKVVKPGNNEKKTKLNKDDEMINDKKDKQKSKDTIPKTTLEQHKANKNNKDDATPTNTTKTIQKSKDEIEFEHILILDSTKEEEDLMNFALTGTEKNLYDSISQEVNTKKRKATEENIKQSLEKKMKPNDKHALLKNIDVDSFLTKVHGPSDKS